MLCGACYVQVGACLRRGALLQQATAFANWVREIQTGHPEEERARRGDVHDDDEFSLPCDPRRASSYL